VPAVDKPTCIESITSATAALQRAGSTDLAALVPTCPGWTVADVITHVGGVHRWAGSIVRSGARPGTPFPVPDERTGADLLAWGADGAAEVVAALEAADPDADVWTFGLPRTVRFWLRRQAHETTLHAWDAGNAVGHAVPIDVEVAADGLDEFLDFVPRGLQREPGSWTGETIHIHRTDGPGEWLLTLGPEGAATVERIHGKGEVAVRGGAVDLLLWATNRAVSDRLEVLGDASLLARWAAEVHF
jgi:uncharacterized protein (TIGR03083 family)